MKKLLFFSCTLAILWTMNSLGMDAQTVKNNVENKNWQALATEIKKGNLSANQFSTYTKAALDMLDDSKYSFFQVLVQNASNSIQYYDSSYRNINDSGNIWNTLEGLILMDKITHSTKIVENAFQTNPANDPLLEVRKNWCVDAYKSKLVSDVKKHQLRIKTQADRSQWSDIVGYLCVQKASHLYLMELTEQQRASLAQQVADEITPTSCNIRKDFLINLQNQLQQLPALQAELRKHNPISFGFAPNKYALGGVIVVALIAFAYKYYHSPTTDEQDDTVEQDNLPENSPTPTA